MLGEIPRIGFGTWQLSDPDHCARAVAFALEIGYRHIDTAEAYGNEAAVGRGIADADVSREDIVIATKVSDANLGYDDVIASAKASRARLGIEMIDLLYVHWPKHTYEPTETLPAFDALYADGVIANVGVSNFEPEDLDRAEEILSVPILANQIEMHPLLPQPALLEEARRRGHWVIAYSPLARGAALTHPIVVDIASEFHASPAQVCLAWLLTKERVIAIPKASSEDHIRENFAAQSLSLSDDAIERLDAIEQRSRQLDPRDASWNR